MLQALDLSAEGVEIMRRLWTEDEVTYLTLHVARMVDDVRVR